MVHSLVLEPQSFASRYTVYPGVRDGRDPAYKAFAAAHTGLTVIDDLSLQGARQIAEAILEQRFRGRPIADYVTEGEKEVTVFHTDPATGVACRVRMDLRHPEFACDLGSALLDNLEQRRQLQAREAVHRAALQLGRQILVDLAPALAHGGRTQPGGRRCEPVGRHGGERPLGAFQLLHGLGRPQWLSGLNRVDALGDLQAGGSLQVARLRQAHFGEGAETMPILSRPDYKA